MFYGEVWYFYIIMLYFPFFSNKWNLNQLCLETKVWLRIRDHQNSYKHEKMSFLPSNDPTPKGYELSV